MVGVNEKTAARTRVADAVYERLRELIFTGELPPGARLSVPALAESLDEHEAAMCAADLAASTEAGLRFHRLIREAAANPEVIRLLDDVQTQVRLAMRTTTVTAGPRQAIDDHRAILTAIESGDAVAAEQAARARIFRLRSVLLRQLCWCAPSRTQDFPPGSRAKFRNAGQVCISPTRFLVHDSVRQDFAKALAEFATGLNVGDGLAEGTEMGPLANTRRVDAMTSLHSDAVERGATVLSGGGRIGDEDNFWAPTVLDDVPAGARRFNEEPFGPVAAIRGFQHVNDAIAEANRLSYGLAGYAFTRSLSTADQLTRTAEVGMLWVNMPAMPSAELPFGGVKDSGYGSEGGPEAMEAYLNTRAVSIAHQ